MNERVKRGRKRVRERGYEIPVKKRSCIEPTIELLKSVVNPPEKVQKERETERMCERINR